MDKYICLKEIDEWKPLISNPNFAINTSVHGGERLNTFARASQQLSTKVMRLKCVSINFMDMFLASRLSKDGTHASMSENGLGGLKFCMP